MSPNLFKYQHARASGYPPALAIAFMRGASLPAKPVSRYMQDVQEQQLAARVRRARVRMPFAGRRGWRMAWHAVRYAENVRMSPVPFEDPTMLPQYITTAGLY